LYLLAINRCCIGIVLLLSLGLYVNAQNYKPVNGKIMTRWGKEVTPENAWREYPRPQLKRDTWQNLNGLWEYAIVPRDSKKPTEFQGNILVPFAVESALSGVGKSVRPEQKVWYRKTFEVPMTGKEKTSSCISRLWTGKVRYGLTESLPEHTKGVRPRFRLM
jgi:hypothetical protein